jgi:hypothetical protein
MAEIVIKLVNGELAGKTAQSIAKEITAAAQAAKKAEIGTKEWIDAHARLDKAKQQQQDLTKQINSTKTASDQLKAAWNTLPGAGFFNQIGQSFGMMKSGVGGLISSFGVLKGAIISTGIGALVVAVGTLVDWFTRTDEGATLMAGAMRGLEMIFDKLTKSVRDFGGWLIAAFENPKQAMMDFVDFIKTQAINRFNAFGVAIGGVMKILDGDFKAGMKDLGDAVGMATLGVENITDKIADFGKEIANTVQEGIELEQELDRIADRARELGVLDAETKKTVDQLLLQSKNVGKNYEERIGLLDRAGKIEQANHQAQLLNAIDLENAMKREVDAKAAVGKVSDELDQKYRDAQKARIDLERESISLQEKIENRRTALEEKRIAETEKQAQAELKIKQNVEDLTVAVMQEGIEKEIAQIQLETQRKIETLTGTEEQILQQKLLLEESQQMQIKAVQDKWALQKTEADLKAKNDQLARDKQLADEQKKIAEDKAKFEQEMQDVEFSIGRDSISFLGELASKRTKDAKDAKRIQKGFALTDIGINLVKELSANAVTAAANPLNSVTFGAAGAAQLLRSNIASIVRAAIGTARVVAFRRGGVLRGPSHENNGIPFTVNGSPGFEAEGDEILLSRGVYRNPSLRSFASAINVAGGGRSFAAGGPVNPFDSSSKQGSGAAASPGGDPFASFQRLEAKFDLYAARVDQWASTLKVQNVVTETADALKTVNRIQAEADV